MDMKESSSTDVMEGFSSRCSGSGIYPLPVTDDQGNHHPTLPSSVKFPFLSLASLDSSAPVITHTPISRKLAGQLGWPHPDDSLPPSDVVEVNKLNLSSNVSRKLDDKTQKKIISKNNIKSDTGIKESSSTDVIQGPSDSGSGVYPLPVTRKHHLTISLTVKSPSLSPASLDLSSPTVTQTPVNRKLASQLGWPHSDDSLPPLEAVESNMLDLSSNVARIRDDEGEGKMELKQRNQTALDATTVENRDKGTPCPLLSKSQLLSMTSKFPSRQGVNSPVVRSSSPPPPSIAPEKLGMVHDLPRTTTGASLINTMFGAAVATSGQKRAEELLKRREVTNSKYVTVSSPHVHDVVLVVTGALDMGKVPDDTTITRLVDHIDCDDDRLQDDHLQYEAVMNSDVMDSYSGPLVALGDTVSWAVQRSNYIKTLSKVSMNRATSFSSY